jgi:uncharacterized protein (TIGR00255 family)
MFATRSLPEPEHDIPLLHGAAGVLLSMTGYGESQTHTEKLGVFVEVRAVNNRHLKLTVRGTDPYPLHESELEKVVRRQIRRGTLHIQIRVVRQGENTTPELNTVVLAEYLKQIRVACDAAGSPDFAAPLVSGVLALPGVSPEQRHGGTLPEDELPVVEKTLEDALAKLNHMRREEGKAIAVELLAHHAFVTEQLAAIRALLPGVVTEYRQRLIERVKQAIADAGVAIQPEHLIREVTLYADRTDVAEEVMRLTSHLEQFSELVRKGEEAGRKLEFVIQEMGRETNTIGSKAGDVAISRHVVEIKSTLEKLREQVQNVE